MLLGFGYLYACYVLFLFFFQKSGNHRLKKKPVGLYCVILFFRILLKVGVVEPVDQHINYVLP